MKNKAGCCAHCGAKIPNANKAAGTAIPVIRKVAGVASVKAANTYVSAWQRGALYDEDPAIRERAWRDTFGAAIENGR